MCLISLEDSQTPPHSHVVSLLIKPPGGRNRVVRSSTVLHQTLEHPQLWFPRHCPACGLECLHWNCLWNEMKYVCISCFSFRERIRRGKAADTQTVCVGWVELGPCLTYPDQDSVPAICFSFWLHSVVFQQWQPSKWKLALTSNYILPGWQGLWDYRAVRLQSALPFMWFYHFSLFTPIITCSSIIFSYFLFPLDNNSFSF